MFSRSGMSDCLQPHGLQHARLPCPSFTISQSLLKPMFIELVIPYNHLLLCHPLLLLPSIFPSIGSLIRWPKYWSFSFSISPSNEYSGLIFFWMDWFDLLAVFSNTTVQASIFPRSAFLIVQFSHPYMTTG